MCSVKVSHMTDSVYPALQSRNLIIDRDDGMRKPYDEKTL